MKKGAGIVLTIIGAICAIIGIVKMNSWEYALAAELGMDTTQVQMILYGGIPYRKEASEDSRIFHHRTILTEAVSPHRDSHTLGSRNRR